MLSDRDYFRNANRPPDRGKKAIWWLIGINVVMYLILAPPGSKLYMDLALKTADIRNLQLYELVSSMFLHAGFWHIAFNMWSLFLFGSLVAPHLGVKKFITLYMISGIFGNLLWILFNWNSPAYLLGASGAAFGVMLAAAMMEPNQEFILLLFPVPIKAKTMVIVFAVMEVFSELSRLSSLPLQENIANLAHLGGFVGAYIFLKFFYKGRLAWDPLAALNLRGSGSSKPPRGWSVHDAKSQDNYRADTGKGSYNHDKPVTSREVDRILDKISQSGINSLTNDERNALKQAREQLRR
ncbi:MAG: rhomboid family intramembrane serine protease [Victivallaceae bacterium]|nr:rhomboid family intramembrane serine protease [Victivallaceae bacterium]